MKLSYNWLKEFVPLDLTPAKLADEITMKAAEVESLIITGKDIYKVVVGEILEIKPHPRATKLQVTKVSVGKDTYDIVCGAKNIRVGQKVPIALIGATLPGGLTIKKRDIRGIASEGMLASGPELGLSEESSEGILILDPKAELGLDVKKILGLDDAVLDINVLPDRAYLLSHVGVARDIAAMRAKPLLLDDYGRSGADAITNSPIENGGSVKILDQTLCSRYSMVMLSKLQIQASPGWLVARLQQMDIRPVNNLVDLTNYIMFELGQPMHAFDSTKLGSQKISVRRAKKGESITTIDDVKRDLTEDMLVITDQKKPIAIAGIMGGKESEINKLTSGAMIESANFEGRSVRTTSQTLKLKTDASYRFERGVDPNLTAVAMARLVELLPLVGLGETQVSKIVDDYPSPLVRQPVRFLPTEVKRLTGVDIPVAEQVRILQGLGMKIDDRDYQVDKELLVTPPSFRADVNHSADIVEEIIRLHGYQRIPVTIPMAELVPQPFETDRHWARKIKNIMRGASFTEIETYSFVGGQLLTKLNFDPREHIALQNPVSENQAYMRGSLIPNALATVQKNIANGGGHMRFYELGRTYRRVRGKRFPHEPLMLCALEVSAKVRPATPRKTAEEWTFLTQLSDSIMFHFGIDTAAITRKPFTANKAFHHGRSAELQLKGEILGYIAEVHPTALAALGIDRTVAILDLRFDTLMKLARGQRNYKKIPKFPAAIRDLSMIVDEKLSAGEVINIIKKAGKAYLKDLELFDRFVGEGIPEGKKSYAFHLIFQSEKGTLKDEKIEKIMAKIKSDLKASKIAIRD